MIFLPLVEKLINKMCNFVTKEVNPFPPTVEVLL